MRAILDLARAVAVVAGLVFTCWAVFVVGLFVLVTITTGRLPALLDSY